MKKQSIVVLILVLFISCGQKKTSNQKDVISDVPLIDSQVIIKDLTTQKEVIDKLFKKEKFITYYVKFYDSKEVYRIKGNIWPDGDIEVAFSILKNQNDKIIAIDEQPNSESGDWSANMMHYFDEKGKTLAIERNTNTFGSGCTDGIAFEKIVEFYDSSFKKLKEVYQLVDKNNRQLSKVKCDGLNIMQSSTEFSNSSELLKNKGLLKAKPYSEKNVEALNFKSDFFISDDPDGPSKINADIDISFTNLPSSSNVNIQISKYNSNIDYSLKYLKTEEDGNSITKWYEITGENSKQFEIFKLSALKKPFKVDGKNYEYNLIFSNYYGERKPYNEMAFLCKLK